MQTFSIPFPLILNPAKLSLPFFNCRWIANKFCSLLDLDEKSYPDIIFLTERSLQESTHSILYSSRLQYFAKAFILEAEVAQFTSR